ncbi:MAG: 3-oxoacyl-ACP reductase FabG [Clostridia bacterium]|nr:3-oxoacyl-ACP reductase FabG [Clostridia bacterium]
MFDEGTVALVTGASGGIGRACALELASHGVTVIVNYCHNRDGAAETLNRILSAGGRGAIIQADIASEEDTERMFRKIQAAFGGIRVLINNAGIIKDGYAMMMPDDAFRQVIDTNLTGTFHCAREALRMMAAAEKGSIVNIASTTGITGSVGQVNYSASKGGIIALTKTLAREYANRGIRVNAVAPGYIETDMIQANRGIYEKQYMHMIPFRRFGQPEEVATAATFLASNHASYITGAVLTADGGMTA